MYKVRCTPDVAKATGDAVLIAARVSAEVADVLDAAAFVRRLSMQGLLAPAIEEFARELEKDNHVASALRARRAADPPNAKVSSIVGKKRATRKA